MLVKDEYHERVDMAVYREVVKPVLSESILDIHAHAWPQPRPQGRLGQYPEFNFHSYPMERLLSAAALMFPEQEYHALIFGSPTPEDYEASNEYVAQESRQRQHMYPLYVPNMRASEPEIREAVLKGGFYGFKPYWTMVDWKSSQDDVTVMDMLPEPCMRVADDLGLIIMLHIPGSQRLSSETSLSGIQTLSRQYPNSKIVIAHVGRSYCLWSIKGGIAKICDLPNVYFDTSFVQVSMVYKVLFDHVDPAKVIYGTDLPISEVRGRRVCINGNWVDVSRAHRSWTASRDAEHAIEGTFMTYEMIRAIREGAEEAGLSTDDLRPIFFDNGMRLIRDVQQRLSSCWVS